MTLLKAVRKHPSIKSDEDEVRTERCIPVVLNELLSIDSTITLALVATTLSVLDSKQKHVQVKVMLVTKGI